LNNGAGGSVVAEVTSTESIAFGTVMADNGTMTLDVEDGSTLHVGTTASPYDYNGDGKVSAGDFTVWRDTYGSTTDLRADGDGSMSVGDNDFTEWRNHYGESTGEAEGRLLVMDGGIVQIDGTVNAATVEVFEGGQVLGSGSVAGDLLNSGGLLSPGSSPGSLSVGGDYVQLDVSTLAIELQSFGEHDLLEVAGDAVLDGFLEISLGFTPTNGNMFTILTAANITENLQLTGDAAGFSLSIDGGTSLVLTYSVEGSGTSVLVPEPATWLTSLFAALGLGALKRNRGAASLLS
jgi:hypothetical protein